MGSTKLSWSLSEFLNLLELRSQTWCYVDLGRSAGFNIPHTERVLFYACLQGTATVELSRARPIELAVGDVVMILNGDAHAVRAESSNVTEVFEFLSNGEYVDQPPTFKMGEGSVARILCGSLKVRWPGAQRPRAMPSALFTKAENNLIGFEQLIATTERPGACALLTRAASFIFTATIRGYPECDKMFRDSSQKDPITQARQLMDVHPFYNWTVETLALKVGMSRSSFAASFTQASGKTPIGYLTEVRMERAARLLEQTDMKISAIGEHIGYRSEAAFSRRFSDYFGMAPGRLRKLARQSTLSAVGH